MFSVVSLCKRESEKDSVMMKLSESGLDTGEIERDFELHKEICSFPL